MAHDYNKIFGAIRALLSGAPEARSPTRTEICQKLVADGIVGSTGTAHKYVSAFFAADALKAQVVAAPEADLSDLPDRVNAAFVALVNSANVLKNEASAALGDLAERSTVTFGKMVAAHDAAQQAEIEELGSELAAARRECEAAQIELAEAVRRGDEFLAALGERDASLAEALATNSDLRHELAVEQTKVVTLIEAIEAGDKGAAATLAEHPAIDRQRSQDSGDTSISEGEEQLIGPPPSMRDSSFTLPNFSALHAPADTFDQIETSSEQAGHAEARRTYSPNEGPVPPPHQGPHQ